MNKFFFLIFLILFVFSCKTNFKKIERELEDKYLWLEEIEGENALLWAKERNEETEKILAQNEEFKKLEEEIFSIMTSKERIPYVSKCGDYFYNFWKDEKNLKGIWRRTTIDEYKKNEPKWEVVLDLDEVSKEEGVSWVWKGADILEPDCKIALVKLSRGGSDAHIMREFDIERKEFKKDGFFVPEAKSEVSWIDENNIYLATDFGPGTLTKSGYPRIVKLWKRGTPIDEEEKIFEGKKEDISVGAYFDNTKGFERHFVYRGITFYEREIFLRENDGKLVKLDIPKDSKFSVHREWMVLELKSPWDVNGKKFKEGQLLGINFEEFLKGGRDFEVLFEPAPNISLSYYTWTKNYLILNTLEDVKSRVWILKFKDGKWEKRPFQFGSGISTISIWAVDEKETDEYFMTITDFLTPTSLFMGKIGKEPEKLKEMPSFFNSEGLHITQHFAKSKDGTKIPYFQVSPKNLKYNGKNKTLLTGYGGFEVSLVPYYSGVVGKGWLEEGGVYVVANIRGGGEYGPKWHKQALKKNRIRCYEDFSAVAKDLIKRKVTSPKYLGIEGGSNGGLLVGNMLTKYPSLFGAVVCQVPLLDMRRYSKLLAGASWVAEYGDPENPEEWKFIKNFSPYHNLKKNKKYPPVLFMTSTRDDRVHPGHARKMAKKMLDMGFEVLYYENIEGGHGGAADFKQAAHMWSLAYTFLYEKLKCSR